MNTNTTNDGNRLLQSTTVWFKIGIILLFGILYFNNADAQVKIGTNPNTIEKSALLELESQTEGLLLPRLTDTLAINALNPPSGMLIYLNKSPKAGVYIRTNGGWNFLSGGGANITTPSATANITGTIQLAGDLGGTSAAPSVPGLALKANTASPAFTGTVTGITGNMVGLGNVNNTADADKPLSNATLTALANKVNAVTGMGLSTENYTTIEKTKLATITGTNTGDQDLSALATTASLGLKENVSNKSTLSTLGTSDALYPSQNAVKTYVDTQVATATIADADVNTRGKIQLTGDLGGTAASPTVPGLLLKAPLSSPAFTGTVTGVTGAMVGLGNVNNTSDLSKPISTLQQAALDLKAPLASPAFTGTPTLPTGTIGVTQTIGTNTTALATTAYVIAANGTNANLTGDVTSSGSNATTITNNAVTLAKLSATGGTNGQVLATTGTALTWATPFTNTLAPANIFVGNATSVATAVGLSGDAAITNSGVLTVGTGVITSAKITDGTIANVDLDKANIPLSGFGAATASVALGSQKITGLLDPTLAQDAATKAYVDANVVTASNGLTKTTGNIALGGALTAATTINQGTNDLTFAGTAKTNIGGTLNTQGAVFGKFKVITGVTTYTVLPDDYVIFVAETGGADITMTMPDATTNLGRVIITIKRSSGRILFPLGTIDAASVTTYVSGGLGITWMSNGLLWYALAQ